MEARTPVGTRRRRGLDLLVIGVVVALVAFAVFMAAGPDDDDEPAASTTTTGPPSTVADVDTFIPLGIEQMADGRVRFHIPACATEGATSMFWHVTLRDRSADLEAWNVDADTPRRLRTAIAGTAPEGFRTTNPLEASRSEMRDDTESIANVFRREPLRSVGARFRLADLRQGQIAYRPEPTGYLHFAASVDELDDAVTCDE